MKSLLNIDYLFDATINRSTFSVQQISDLIVNMYEKKVAKQIVERHRMEKVI